MEIRDLLDLAKKSQGFSTDMALAKGLGISRSAVSSWRNGISTPDTVQCAALAGYTGLPLAQVLGIVGEARAISREEKAVWRKLAATAAMLALFVAPSLIQQVQAASLHNLPSSDPSTAAAATEAAAHSRHYAKWWTARYWLARFVRNPPSTIREAYVWA